MQSSPKNYPKKGNDKTIKKLDGVYAETEELISIIGKSIITAKKNNKI